MSNHPNRNKDRANNSASNPRPYEILAMRKNLGITQEQAGKVVYSSLRRWQAWELNESRMHPAIWELFLIKTNNNLDLADERDPIGAQDGRDS